MLFWLKKTISYWLMPLSYCVAALLVGLWLMRSPRRERLGRRLLLAAVLTLILFSNKWVGNALLGPLERRYAPVPELVAGRPLPAELAACRYVVVLGGGNGYSQGFSANNLLWGPSLARITEGVRLSRALPHAKLIVSGAGAPNREPHARVMGRTALAFGIEADRIIYLDDPRDTEDEANGVARVTQGGTVALVTSGWHMPRAVPLFRSAGVTVVPCPTDFLTHGGGRVGVGDLLWDVGALGTSSLGLRERIGYLWIWLRRKT